MSILSKINDLIAHAENLVIDMSVPVAVRRAALRCADEMTALVGPLEEVIGLVGAEVRAELQAQDATPASAPTPAQVAQVAPAADQGQAAEVVPADPTSPPPSAATAPITTTEGSAAGASNAPRDVQIPAPATTTHQPDQPADTTPATTPATTAPVDTTAPVPDPAPAEATAAAGVDPAVLAAVQQVLAERQATGSQGVQG